MAFPTVGTRRALAFVLTEAQSLARSVSAQAAAISEKSATGEMMAREVVLYQVRLKEQLDRLLLLRDVKGIGQFAHDEFDDPLQDPPFVLDIVAEFNAMTTEIQGTLDWIRTNIPVSAGGFIEGQTIGREELLAALRKSLRQRSMGRRARREYVLRYLNEHPP